MGSETPDTVLTNMSNTGVVASAETVFGQSVLGHSIFAHRVLGPANFGQIHSWPIRFRGRVGAPKGGGPKILCFFFFPSPAAVLLFLSFSGWFFWWCLEAPDQNSTRRHPVRDTKSETGGGRGKKSAKFWAVQRRTVRKRAVRRVMPAFGQTAFGQNRIWPKKKI